MSALNRVEVDLSAIRGNLKRLVDLAGGAGIMAVVKAHAYSHGAATEGAGAAWLGVARPGEAPELRTA